MNRVRVGAIWILAATILLMPHGQPWILISLSVILFSLATWHVIQYRRQAQIRKSRMDILHRLVRNRYMFSPLYSGDKRVVHEALTQGAAMFSDSPDVVQTIRRLEEIVADPNSPEALVEERLIMLLSKICREVKVDPAVLTVGM